MVECPSLSDQVRSVPSRSSSTRHFLSSSGPGSWRLMLPWDICFQPNDQMTPEEFRLTVQVLGKSLFSLNWYRDHLVYFAYSLRETFQFSDLWDVCWRPAPPAFLLVWGQLITLSLLIMPSFATPLLSRDIIANYLFSFSFIFLLL